MDVMAKLYAAVEPRHQPTAFATQPAHSSARSTSAASPSSPFKTLPSSRWREPMSSKRPSSPWRRASPAETCASCTTPRTLYRTKWMGYLCVRRAPASTSSCPTLEASPEKMRSAIEAMTEHRALRNVQGRPPVFGGGPIPRRARGYRSERLYDPRRLRPILAPLYWQRHPSYDEHT